MKAKGEIPDPSPVGEPTSREAPGKVAPVARIGEVAAIDRRLPDLHFAEPPCPA